MSKNEKGLGIASRHHFGDHFGSFWVPFGEPWGVTLGKKGIRTGIQKMERKTRVRQNPRRPGRDPVRPYKQSFLEPCGTFLAQCGSTTRILCYNFGQIHCTPLRASYPRARWRILMLNMVGWHDTPIQPSGCPPCPLGASGCPLGTPLFYMCLKGWSQKP